jgi:hypothetical protein
VGIRDRIKRRLKGARDLLGQVSEEASYPGRPQPHMAARNPLWGGAEDKPPPDVTPKTSVPAAPSTPSAGVDPYASSDATPEGEDDYWFLKDNEVEDGWRETNPNATAKKEDD